MKRYSGLYNQIIPFNNLYLASQKAFRGKKDKERVSLFYFHLETELLKLERELKNETYQLSPYRLFTIYEPKERQICAADFRDRVVHHAICNVMEPIWDKTLISDTYACRKNKGTHRAIHRVQEFSKRYPYFFKCDIRKYFDSIDHGVLHQILRKKIKDPQLLNLLDQIIETPVSPLLPSGKGLPIGNLTSQYFANLYLGELDQCMKSGFSLKVYVRYMDDIICFGYTKSELDERKEQIETFLKERLFLKLKDKMTLIAPVSEGIPYLGVRIFRGMIRLQRERWLRFQRKFRVREQAFLQGDLEEDCFINSMNGLMEQTRWADSLRARQHFLKDQFVLEEYML